MGYIFISGTEKFTITHPFHPMKGKTFGLIERKLVWCDDRILYLDKDSNLRLIQTNFTDIYEEGPFVAISNGRCDITFDSLVSLVNIIKAIKQPGKA